MLPGSPQITSFIIRFVHSDPAEGEQPIRGSVRHILSHQQIHFTHWQEAVHFINQFVPLEADAAPEGDSQPGIE